MLRPALHVLTSSSWGGLEMYVVSLIKEQAARGQRVAAYVLRESAACVQLEASGIPVFYAKKRAHVSMPDIQHIKRLIREQQFDVIHSHTSLDVWPGSLAAYGTRVGHIHSTYVNVMPKRDLHHFVIYRRVNAIVSSSEATNEIIRRKFPVSKGKVHLVRYGWNLDRFKRSPELRARVRQELGIADDEIAFGIIGRIEHAKGIREFAHSLLELSEATRKKVKYLIVGARNYEERDEYFQNIMAFSLRSDVRDHLRVLPWKPDVVEYLNAMDVSVMASHKEMYALTVLEAMAMGLPVIGTNAGGTPEQIGTNERGLLVEPYSSSSIAGAVERYAAHPELMGQHGEAARKWVHEQHTMERSLNVLAGIYESVVQKCHGRASAQQAEVMPAGI